MTIEVRYIVFSVEETRKAILSFVGKQFHSGKEDVGGIEILGHDESLSVVVHLPARVINITTSDLLSLLLLYCRDHRIPVPQRSQKKVQRSAVGLTLVLSTNMIDGGVPFIVDDRLTYRDDAVGQELSTVRQELTRTIARAEEAERKAAKADARAAAAEKVRAEAAAMLPVSGVRGLILRLLANGKESA